MSYPPTPPTSGGGPVPPYGSDPSGAGSDGPSYGTPPADPYAAPPYGSAPYGSPYGAPYEQSPANMSEADQAEWLRARMRDIRAAQGGAPVDAGGYPAALTGGYPAAVPGPAKAARVDNRTTIPTAVGAIMATCALVLGGLGGWFVVQAGAEPVADYANPVAVDASARGEGTRLDPYVLGETVATDEWTVTIGDPVDSTAQILADNPYFERSDLPLVEDGESAFLLPLTLVNTSDVTQEPAEMIRVSYLVNDGAEYGFSYCGDFADSLDDAPALAAGDSVTLNACVVAPSTGTGQWQLTTDQSFGTFFTQSSTTTEASS